MQDDKWDEEIKKLFDEVEGEYDPASWQKLSDRMDAMDSEEEADELFDKTIKNKLNPHKASTPPQWDEMEATLVELEERRRNIITTKSLEVIILVLLVFTLWNFRSHTVVDLDSGYVKTIKVENQVLENVMADIEHSPQVEEKAIKRNASQTKKVISAEQNEFYNNILHRANVSFSKKRKPQLKSPIANRPLATISSPGVEVSKVSELPLKPLDVNYAINIEPTTTSLEKDESKDQAYNGWTAGITQSYDVNFVNSDVTLGYLGDQIGSGLSGHSVAITGGRRMGAIEVSSGLGYSHKSYAPGLHTQYQKASADSPTFVQSQLDQITFEQLQIPLSVKLFAAPKQRTSFYLIAGAIANVLLKTDYTLRRTIQANARPAADPRANIIDLTSPPLGIGNGGSVKDNFYATGVIGFGVQSYLNNGISLFIQPQYQHTLTKGINEVANEINTLSFSAGLSFTL